MTLDDGTKVWEALDDGNWATLKIYQEASSQHTLVRLVTLADTSPETSMDENLILAGQWAVKDVDWVEFYKHSSMFPGGENDQIYGLAFATADQCTSTTAKIEETLRSAYPDTGPQVEEQRPVSLRPSSLANTKRPGSSKSLGSDPDPPRPNANSNDSAELSAIIQQQQEQIEVEKEMETLRVKSERIETGMQKAPSLKRIPSYKTAPPPPPTDSPIRHSANSISLVPPETGAGSQRIVAHPKTITAPTLTPPVPQPHTPQPSPGHVRVNSGNDLDKVRISDVRRPSGTLSTDGPLGLEINVDSDRTPLKSVGRKMSLASFTNVEAAILNATENDNSSMAQAVEVEKLKLSSRTLSESLSSSTKKSTSRLGSNMSELSAQTEDGEDDEPDDRVTQSTCSEPNTVAATRSKTASMVDNGISLPTNVTKGIHVVYNEELARYEGLPDGAEWKVMNKQFGIPLGAVPKRTVEGYEERIPAVLEMLKNYLLKNGGVDIVGIFRLAPDKDDCNWAKQQINEGEFAAVDDVNIVANLIKVFFRELPVSLLDQFRDEDICKISEMEVGESVIKAVEEVCASQPSTLSVILWLFDLMCEVVQNEKVNKMSAKNMAIVMSPNLYSINSENPMVALTMSQKVADFCTVLLKSRLMVKYNYSCMVK